VGTPLGKGIDFNQEPASVYAFHLLFGHHGWFSLTPVWFLALAGLAGLGIRSAADVRQYLSAGASLVAIGTAALADPRLPERVVADLEREGD
jgi:hypothetical protein